MSELVTAFFLSELATYSVTDPDIPLLYGIIPILVMVSLEVIVSFLSIKVSLIKKAFDFEPSILIFNGEIQKQELVKNRVTVEELFSQLRLCGFFDVTKIKCAVLEPNGQVSVLPFSKEMPPSRGDLNLLSEDEIATAVIVEGKIKESAVRLVGKERNWLEALLKNKGVALDRVFLAVADENGIKMIMRKGKK